ncbi:hypothetical protein ACEOWJ_001218 [Bacillus cereus]|uniref:hypothetical protein n=1 Tax=Bacillus TaxID=1386 RepID=UPI0005550C37|nr:hypothetical protein [Bacillus sp. UNC322MFChir4.1]
MGKDKLALKQATSIVVATEGNRQAQLNMVEVMGLEYDEATQLLKDDEKDDGIRFDIRLAETILENGYEDVKDFIFGGK